MPSARSASWPNQGLSGTARHFPGLGILAKIVYARTSVIAGVSQTDLPGQSPENTINILVQQSTAAFRHKEVRAAARSKMGITLFDVSEQRFAGCPMQGHEARFAELALPDRQDAFIEIHVAALKSDRLGQPHACHCDQPE